jgi:hypothetical protein
MGSPFKMMPGSKSGASRDRGLMQMAQRGLIAGGPKTHEGGKVHPKSESLSKKAPSATIKSRKVVNKPGSVTTSKTKSSSGKKTTAAYDAAIKAEGTRILPKGQKSTKAMTDLYNAKRAKAKATDKANSASSSSSSKTVITQPSREVKESSRQESRGRSAYDIQKDAENANENASRIGKRDKEFYANKAAKDSINEADTYRRTQVSYKGQKAMSNPAVTTEAVRRGNAAGRKSAEKSGYFTEKEGKEMFNPNYGQSTATAGPQGYKSKSSKSLTLKPGGTQRASSKYNSQIAPGSKEDVGGQIKKGSKKGSKTFSKKDANAGTRGSRG